MPRAATGRQRDLAHDWRVFPHEAAQVIPDVGQRFPVRGVQPLEHVVDEVVGIVEDFFHGCSVWLEGERRRSRSAGSRVSEGEACSLNNRCVAPSQICSALRIP